MPNQRKTDKKKIGVWVTPAEQKQLEAAMKKHGFANLADFLRAVASGVVKVSPHIKVLALAAMGTQSGGCLVFILAIPAALWLFC